MKETQEILTAVAGLVGGIVAKAKDGLTGQEVFEVTFANMSNIMIAADGADKVKAEFNGSTRDFLKLVVGFALNIAFSFKK